MHAGDTPPPESGQHDPQDPDPQDSGSPSPGSQEPGPPPLDEVARRIGAAGKALGYELWTAARALRALFMAELALSRTAILRVLLLAAIGTALGATAWLYLMAMGVLGLQAMGLPWWAAVGIPALVSLLGAGVCGWLALKALEDTQFRATRRQLARFGVGDDPDEIEKDPENVA